MRSAHILRAAMSTLVLPALTLAVPNQHLNPHSDAPADISWDNGDAGVPDTHNHLHLKLRTGETITQNASSISSNKNWAADSVWDDRFFRFTDTAPSDGGLNADARKFGHGYIDTSFHPRYVFEASVPALAKTKLTATFGAWSTAADTAATAVGNQTPAGTATDTSIVFSEVASAGELSFKFVEGFQESDNAFAEWIASTEQASGAHAAKTMVYEATPTMKLFAPAGWEIRNGNAGTFGAEIAVEVGWHFDNTTAPAVASTVDVDYRKIGETDVHETLTGVTDAPGSMSNNVFGQLLTIDELTFEKMDFYTIALHETGHILGLLHAAGDPASNIMRSQIANDAAFGSTLRTIDGDSAYGAAALYTIPVPEPAMATVVLLLALRRRR